MRSRGEERERKVEIISGTKKKCPGSSTERRGLALAGNLKNHYSWIVIGSDLKRPRGASRFCEKIDTGDQSCII